MSTVRVKCIDQTLTLTNTPLISSGGIQEDHVSFSFCPLWNGFYKTAVFWRSEADSYHVILDETNSCAIPPEVLTAAGVVHFGVFGVNDAGVQRTSNVLRYNIELGTITEGTQPSDPTPDIYTQLLAAVAALGDNKGKADKVESPTAGNLASLDANGNPQDSGKKPADFVPVTEKGKPSGVATLDESGKIPEAQLPETDCLATETKGQPNGVASLDEEGKVPREQMRNAEFGENVVWLVPFSFPDLTTFDTPDTNEDGDQYSFHRFFVKLPEDIDCSKYVYEFVLDVYGISRYGDNSVNTNCAEICPVIKGTDRAGDTLVRILTTSKLPSSGTFDHLSFPSLGRYEIEQMETGRLYTAITGRYKGEDVAGYYELVKNGDVLGTNVYDRIRVEVQTGNRDNLEPVETYGIKLKYRAIRKRG